MVSLLKAKSKIILNTKSRKKYEIADVFPKRKIQNINSGGNSNCNQLQDRSAADNSQTKKIAPTILEKYEKK